VLGEFTRQNESHRCLDLSRRDCRLLVVSSEFRGFGCDTLEDVVDERVQDGHGTSRNTSIRVDLLENFVDVRRVGFLPGLAALLLLARSSSCGLLAGFLLLSGGLSSRGLATSAGLLLGSFGRHFVRKVGLFVVVEYKLIQAVKQQLRQSKTCKTGFRCGRG
jgi:hypothetical protein